MAQLLHLLLLHRAAAAAGAVVHAGLGAVGGVIRLPLAPVVALGLELLGLQRDAGSQAHIGLFAGLGTGGLQGDDLGRRPDVRARVHGGISVAPVDVVDHEPMSLRVEGILLRVRGKVQVCGTQGALRALGKAVVEAHMGEGVVGHRDQIVGVPALVHAEGRLGLAGILQILVGIHREIVDVAVVDVGAPDADLVHEVDVDVLGRIGAGDGDQPEIAVGAVLGDQALDVGAEGGFVAAAVIGQGPLGLAARGGGIADAICAVLHVAGADRPGAAQGHRAALVHLPQQLGAVSAAQQLAAVVDAEIAVEQKGDRVGIVSRVPGGDRAVDDLDGLARRVAGLGVPGQGVVDVVDLGGQDVDAGFDGLSCELVDRALADVADIIAVGVGADLLLDVGGVIAAHAVVGVVVQRAPGAPGMAHGRLHVGLVLYAGQQTREDGAAALGAGGRRDDAGAGPDVAADVADAAADVVDDGAALAQAQVAGLALIAAAGEDHVGVDVPVQGDLVIVVVVLVIALGGHDLAGEGGVLNAGAVGVEPALGIVVLIHEVDVHQILTALELVDRHVADGVAGGGVAGEAGIVVVDVIAQVTAVGRGAGAVGDVGGIVAEGDGPVGVGALLGGGQIEVVAAAGSLAGGQIILAVLEGEGSGGGAFLHVEHQRLRGGGGALSEGRVNSRQIGAAAGAGQRARGLPGGAVHEEDPVARADGIRRDEGALRCPDDRGVGLRADGGGRSLLRGRSAGCAAEQGRDQRDHKEHT